jgi:hypothetical protein
MKLVMELVGNGHGVLDKIEVRQLENGLYEIRRPEGTPVSQELCISGKTVFVRNGKNEEAVGRQFLEQSRNRGLKGDAECEIRIPKKTQPGDTAEAA